MKHTLYKKVKRGFTLIGGLGMKFFISEYVMPYSRDIISAVVAFLVAYTTARWQTKGIKKANIRNYWQTKFKVFCDDAKAIDNGIIEITCSSSVKEKNVKYKKLSQDVKIWSNSLDEIYDENIAAEYKIKAEMKEFQQIGRTISDKKRYERFYGIIPQRLSGKKVLPEKDIKKIDDFRSFVSENTLKLIRTGERIIKKLSA